jgi:hypothetical protein
MPYTTIVAGTSITASWANASVRDQVVTPFATAAARSSAISSPVEGMVSYLSDDNYLEVYNGAAWVNVTPVSATVATEETTTSTSYTDLSTSGPAVTLRTGTKALVIVSCQFKNSALGNLNRIGWAVSGATTVAASDTYAAIGTSDVANYYNQISTNAYYASLTAGSNTFTAKYAVAAGTGSFLRRTITVIGIP